MLVIRRRAGESVLVGDSIEIEVLEVQAGRVILGIHAPADVLLLRKELRVVAEANRLAACLPEEDRLRTLARGLNWPAPSR
jgi:carbon storage regulator